MFVLTTDHMTSLIKEVKFAKMATGGIDSMSDELINVKCCVCLEENRTREAEKYCVDCKNYYCSSCVGMHKKIPMMKGHNILNKADFKTLSKEGSLPSFPTQRCFLHKEEVVKLYCKDHDMVECASCIALTHRSCKHVVSIAEDIDNLYKKVSLSDVKLKLSNTKKNMEEIKKTKETKLQKLKGELNQKIESVKAFRQELQALLDLMERETIKELKREFTRIEASLAKDINEVETLITSLNEVASQLNKFEGNKAQVFVCVKLHQKLAAKGQEAVNSQQMTIDETVSFRPDHSIKTFLQQNKLLGKVSVDRSESKLHTCKSKGQIYTPKVPIMQAEGQIYTPKDRLYRVKQQREINVKLKNDKTTCYIWGTCVTEDGALLLADYDNNRLKCVDMSTYKVKAYIDLPAAPSSVCTISKTEAAVTLENQSVQFVSLGDTMTVTRTLTMTHHCYGLVCRDGKLYISDWHNTVYMYNMTGQELKRITQDASGRDIFQLNQHIAVSASEDRVFVADWHKGVVVLDSQGNYLTSFTDISVSGCSGVCTDGRNMFVFGYSSNNIVQFGQDFKMLGVIAKVAYLESLCFDHKQKRLIATGGSNDKVTILELE